MPGAKRRLGAVLTAVGAAWVLLALSAIAVHLLASRARYAAPAWPGPLSLDATIAVASLPGFGILALGVQARRPAAGAGPLSEPRFGAVLVRSALGAVVGALCFVTAALVVLAVVAVEMGLGVLHWLEPACWLAAAVGAAIGVEAATP